MKFSIIFSLFLACQSLLFGQEPLEVPSEVKSATVFLRGAQLEREGNINLKKGKNEIVFRGLETGINPKSIQVAASENVIIFSVVHQVNYLNQQKNSPEVEKLRDSLRILDEFNELETTKAGILNEEKKLILANQVLAGDKEGLSITELEKAADFFRKRLTDIQERLLKVSHQQRWINNRRSFIKQQLQELNYVRNQASNDILVTLEADQPRKEMISLAYLVNDAGWNPSYDLRAKDSKGPIQLEYRAEVFQQTGLDWEQVKLTLSSGNPNLGGQQPNLNPWNLYVYNPGDYGGRKTTMDAMYKKEEAKTRAPGKPTAGFGKAGTLANYTTVQESPTTSEFVISIPQDIPANGKKQQVSIQNSELPATYQHFAIPKLDKDAFLVARVTDWERLNLLPGRVNIYFEGTYVAESYINPQATLDTLDFSLGRDKKVVIQREMLKNYNQTRILGTQRERTFGYEITIRNTKRTAADLRLEDHIPVSQDENISVKLEESSNGTWEENTGKITWNLDLSPTETQTIRLVFSVKYPKKSTVSGL